MSQFNDGIILTGPLLNAAFAERLLAASNLSDLPDKAAARSNLNVLGIGNNLSDLSNIATARSNLGLGSLALQAANAVAITGGSITGVVFNNAAIGLITPAAAKFTAIETTTGITKLASGAGAGDYVLVATNGAEAGVGALQRGKLIVKDTLAMYGNQTYIRQASNSNTDYLSVWGTNVRVGVYNSTSYVTTSTALLFVGSNLSATPLLDIGPQNGGTGAQVAWFRVNNAVSAIDVDVQIGNTTSTTLQVTSADGNIKANGSFRPATNASAALGAPSVGFSKFYLDYSNITPGTTGNQTINKPLGRVNIAAGQSSVTVTNNLVTTATFIVPTLATLDATAKTVVAVPGNGSFTLTLNAAATAEVAVGFSITNTN